MINIHLQKTNWNLIIAMALTTAILFEVVSCVAYFVPIYLLAKHSFGMAITGAVLGFITLFIGVLKG